MPTCFIGIDFEIAKKTAKFAISLNGNRDEDVSIDHIQTKGIYSMTSNRDIDKILELVHDQYKKQRNILEEEIQPPTFIGILNNSASQKEPIDLQKVAEKKGFDNPQIIQEPYGIAMGLYTSIVNDKFSTDKTERFVVVIDITEKTIYNIVYRIKKNDKNSFKIEKAHWPLRNQEIINSDSAPFVELSNEVVTRLNENLSELSKDPKNVPSITQFNDVIITDGGNISPQFRSRLILNIKEKYPKIEIYNYENQDLVKVGSVPQQETSNSTGTNINQSGLSEKDIIDLVKRQFKDAAQEVLTEYTTNLTNDLERKKEDAINLREQDIINLVMGHLKEAAQAAFKEYINTLVNNKIDAIYAGQDIFLKQIQKTLTQINKEHEDIIRIEKKNIDEEVKLRKEYQQLSFDTDQSIQKQTELINKIQEGIGRNSQNIVDILEKTNKFQSILPDKLKNSDGEVTDTEVLTDLENIIASSLIYCGRLQQITEAEKLKPTDAKSPNQ